MKNYDMKISRSSFFIILYEAQVMRLFSTQSESECITREGILPASS